MAEVRLHYQEDLANLEQRALGGIDLVIASLDRTLEAVEHKDAELAELVIADDDRIDGRYLEVHQEILTMLATQAPVATDLRLISALLHVMHSIERMGDQCVNIAKVIPLTGGIRYVTLEDFRFGCPVLSYDIKYGPRDQITDGVDGFLVPAGDLTAMADRVVQLIDDPALVSRLSDQALLAAGRYDHEAYVRAWADTPEHRGREQAISGPPGTHSESP